MLHCARVWQSGGQPGVQPGAYVPVRWTSIDYDPAGFLTLHPGDTSRLVCPPGGGGLYAVGCQVAGVFAEGLFGYEYGLARNGAYFVLARCPPGDAAPPCAGHVALQPGDFVQLLVRHAVPTPLTLKAAGSLYPALWLARLGSAPAADAVMAV